MIEIIDQNQTDAVADCQARFPCVAIGRCELVTQHAIDQYRSRAGSTKGDVSQANKIATRIASGVEMKLKPKFLVIEMIDHGVHARYFRHADMMFVVENGVCVTCHHGTADRWIPMTAQ